MNTAGRYASLQGRAVIVTGAGRGFGRLIALALVEQGARVLGTSTRAGAELLETATAAAAAIQASGLGGEFAALQADVSRPEDCERTVDEAIRRFGRLDVLVNNAARGPLEADSNYFAAKPRFWNAPPDAYRTMVETNLLGPFFMARAAVPGMVERRFGRVINVSTSRPTMVMQGLAAYGATKAGLEVNSVVWAKDLEGSGVTVNVLLPGGPSDTALIPGGDEGRIGGILPAEVIVPPALWLCADESGDYSGRRLVAKDWDPELPWRDALARALQPRQSAPSIM